MTPQEIDRLEDLATRSERVLLTGPVDPDGDSIGACLALAAAIRRVAGHPVQVDVAGEPGFRYAWLSDARTMVPDDAIRGRYDLVIVADGDRHRLAPAVDRAFQAARWRAVIDHHRTTTPDGYDLALIDAASASTCQMVITILERWGIELDRQAAEQLYVGILFDTGGFRHSNTDPATLRDAARLLDHGVDHVALAERVLVEKRVAGMRMMGRVLDLAEFHASGRVAMGVLPLSLAAEVGAGPGDVEGIVDALVYVQGVEVAVLVVEREPGKVKLSLRSRGNVDVSSLAKSLHASGGGHPKAAGVVMPCSLEEALKRVPRAVVAAVVGASAA